MSDGSTKQHRFIDEMGDTTFFGRKNKNLLGMEGVSLSFGLGMIKFNGNLDTIRTEVRGLQKEVEEDSLLNTIPSVSKRMEKQGFFFHACKDTPDVRSVFLRYLRESNCVAEIVVARKIPRLYVSNHQSKPEQFYADVLSHLIKNQMNKDCTVVLNIAERGSSTRDKVLTQALEIATARAHKKFGSVIKTNIVFNVQTPVTEPLLNVADYLCWSVQRVFEKGEIRYYDYLREKIRLVVDLYDTEKYKNWQNYYNPDNNPLTSANKIVPQST